MGTRTYSQWYNLAVSPALYFDSAEYVSTASVSFSPLRLGGLYVKVAGSTIAESVSAYDRSLYLGDSTAAKDSYYVFERSFALSGYHPDRNLYGTVNVIAVQGATFTLPSAGIAMQSGSKLKMHGAGQIAIDGTITATGNVTLDYSDVESGSTFIQGALTIDDSTMFAFPADFAANTPYQLCSGTLTVGSTSLQKSITVGSNTFLADLTFDTSAKTVSYCPARTTTVSGGTTEWSSLTWANGTGTAGWASGANAHITVSAASTISVGSATTVNKLKLLGSADLTITGVGNLTVGSFDLSEYTGNLNIAVDSAATVGTLKFIGSTCVAINGISNSACCSRFSITIYRNTIVTLINIYFKREFILFWCPSIKCPICISRGRLAHKYSIFSIIIISIWTNYTKILSSICSTFTFFSECKYCCILYNYIIIRDF